LINLKKENKQNQSQHVNNDLAKINYRKQQKSQQIPPHPVSEKKPAITRKPIIITKMKLKKFFSF
jgi:hypothetical protein